MAYLWFISRSLSLFVIAGLASPVHAVPTAPSAVSLTDFDGDGLRDLMVEERGVQLVALNDGGGRFDNWRRIEAPAEAGPSSALSADRVSFCVGDLDRDGDNDLALLRTAPPRVVVLIQRRGGFEADAVHVLETGTRGIALRDADGDGAPELVALGLRDHRQILWNDGRGHFSQARWR